MSVVIVIVVRVPFGVTESGQLVVGVLKRDRAPGLIGHGGQKVVGIGEDQALSQVGVVDGEEMSLAVVCVGQRVAVGVRPGAAPALRVKDHASISLSLGVVIVALLEQLPIEAGRGIVRAVGHQDVLRRRGAKMGGDGVVDQLIHGPVGSEIGNEPPLDGLLVVQHVQEHVGKGDQGRGVGGLAPPQSRPVIVVESQRGLLRMAPPVSHRS